jgi:hypothetical protein
MPKHVTLKSETDIEIAASAEDQTASLVPLPTRAEVLEKRAKASAQLSTQGRTLSVASMALAWALLTSKDSPFGQVSGKLKLNLVGVLVAAIVALILDFIHYVAAFQVEEGWLTERPEKANRKQGQYTENWVYKTQRLAFALKLWSIAIAGIWLLFIIGFWLFM